jgi:meiotically up-regulated gene 157 (Mug157) protein
VLEKDGKKVFAYEVNGRGDSVIFDDANLPSLVSLAYLGFVSLKDEVYSNTRAYMLSNKNPFFYENQQYKGIGSSHTPVRTIWPLALITQILTSSNDDEIKQCLKGLLDQASDNLMHESFSIDNPHMITRNWFAWANSLFGEAVIKLATERPDLLK